jgi:hypothetical protein
MNYKKLKSESRRFIRIHHAYFWGVLEFSMICAAAYSLFGLILLSTGALATSNTIEMMLLFMIAPLYAAVLFVSVTTALCVLLTLPYAIALGLHLPGRPAVAVQPIAAKKPRRKPAARSPRPAKA